MVRAMRTTQLLESGGGSRRCTLGSFLLEESSKIGHCLRYSSNDHIGISKLLDVLVVLEWNLEISMSHEHTLWSISKDLAKVIHQCLHRHW